MSSSNIIILASASPRRKQILESMGFAVTVDKPVCNETFYASFPVYTPIVNARMKTQAVADAHPDQFVLAADTIINFDNQIIGKPENMAEARAFLSRFSGRSHDVITAVCIAQSQSHVCCVFTETSTVHFRHLSPSLIEDYFARVNPLDKAGAYGIQEHGDMIIDHYEGDIDNIIGLPRKRTSAALSACLNAVY